MDYQPDMLGRTPAEARQQIHYSFKFMHKVLTWIIAWWSFILILPGDTFLTSQSYKYFLATASEERWAGFFALVAAVGIAGLRWKPLLYTSTHLLAITHGTMAAMIFCAAPYSTATGVYGALSFSAFYMLWHRGKTGEFS